MIYIHQKKTILVPYHYHTGTLLPVVKGAFTLINTAGKVPFGTVYDGKNCSECFYSPSFGTNSKNLRSWYFDIKSRLWNAAVKSYLLVKKQIFKNQTIPKIK